MVFNGTRRDSMVFNGILRDSMVFNVIRRDSMVLSGIHRDSGSIWVYMGLSVICMYPLEHLLPADCYCYTIESPRIPLNAIESL